MRRGPTLPDALRQNLVWRRVDGRHRCRIEPVATRGVREDHRTGVRVVRRDGRGVAVCFEREVVFLGDGCEVESEAFCVLFD